MDEYIDGSISTFLSIKTSSLIIIITIFFYHSKKLLIFKFQNVWNHNGPFDLSKSLQENLLFLCYFKFLLDFSFKNHHLQLVFIPKLE
jgi:hypothetical protein